MQRVTVALAFAIIFACSKPLLALSREQEFAFRAQIAKCLQSAPKPNYSAFTAAHHFSGSGIFIMRIHVKTGRVAEVHVARSTGHGHLDAAAVRALSEWRFKPDCLKPVGDPYDALLRIPVTFDLRE